MGNRIHKLVSTGTSKHLNLKVSGLLIVLITYIIKTCALLMLVLVGNIITVCSLMLLLFDKYNLLA